MFSDLAPADLQDVADTCVVKNLERGEYLFREKEKAEGFFVMHQGSVNVHRVTPEGKEQVIAVFRPPEAFAEITLTTIDTYPADGVALEASQVILVRKTDFRALILRKPELSLRMLTSMSYHLKYLVQMIEDLKFKQIEARLANWLLRNSSESTEGRPVIVRLDVSKRVLASQLGVASETFSRALAKFREESLIAVDGPEITLLDRSGLMDYVKG
ncbi:Crp/Fnr family transcriptional regulator [Pelagicoccus sp. SDUM812003]|uniref:Crp/Fnr family transcriptional regulator n=1 Tax=Pelagicoccus sp. SDUM812003 TaxID=3041267 RepID=UPI00280D5E95|nr:Crp/Fnr family transcriptional regulator [Pelagicoccus sp. SDUM812003]MDQ8202224.1 Crp/Fnr family transcriptional regulator [Pelagicoccus sp. SDUM812003]